ncbi:MAG: GTP-binding protein, partial [Bacteroidota bacterium]
DYLPELTEVIQKLNPHAYVFTGENGAFPIDSIMGVGSLKAESIEEKFALTAHNHEAHHQHDHKINNSHSITTFALTFDYPFNLKALSLELHRLATIYRSQVYRVKGIIALPDYQHRVILQSVRTTFVASDGSPWQEGEKRQSKIVFIGRGLKKEAFMKMFSRYMVVESG